MLSLGLNVMYAVIQLCDFAMQIVTGISSPFILSLSYYSEDRVLEVMGASFLTELLNALKNTAAVGLSIQFVQFTGMVVYNLILQMIVGT